MLGGYQILDLRKIDLTITKTLSNITDAYVLSQLLKLRDFIDKDYDFSKPIENQLKPVLIRYRDKKNGEKNEGAMFGELAIVNNYYTFQITGRISGYLILTIKVAFQEITNAYGAKEWVINTAKIKLQDVMDDLEGNLALEGDLDVSGDVDVGGDLTVTGSINGEENPSVKPIYWHGLDIFTPSKISLQAHVLKNDNYAIDTTEKLLAWVESLGVPTVKLACCGSLRISNEPSVNAVCHFIRFNVSDGSITSISAYYVTDSGYANKSYTRAEFLTEFENCNDDMNKIN